MNKNILYRFFSGKASFEEEEAVCNWVDLSNRNKEIFIKERKQFDLILFQSSLSDNNKRFFHKTNLKSYIKDFLTTAAVICLLCVTALSIYKDIAKTNNEIMENKIIVPPGQRVNIILSDGSNIWLNACSELIYPTSFSQDSRIVSLKGEAFFDIAKNEKQPFVVQTTNCNINVLGTKFNVRTDYANCDFDVALFEGAIKLTNKIEEDSELMLLPMQKAEFKDGKFLVDSIQEFDRFRWIEGLICFDNILFTDLMLRFEQIYDIKIVVQNPILKDYKCSGKCRVADGIDYILKLLQRNRSFSFTRNDDNTYIYID